MKKNERNIRENVIKETFSDNRKIVSSVNVEELDIDKDIHQGGDIFITSKGDFIDLELQLQDFTEDELIKYVELAEDLSEKYDSEVSIYILCPKDVNVCVRECEIKSNATFTIKLACIQETPCEIMLNSIKAKIKANEILDSEDLEILSSLPAICEKEKRNYYRKEYLRIMNKLHY